MRKVALETAAWKAFLAHVERCEICNDNLFSFCQVGRRLFDALPDWVGELPEDAHVWPLEGVVS